MTANTRRAVYVLALAVIGVLVGYGVIHDDQRELWTTLVYALIGLAPITALTHITPDPPVYVEPVGPSREQIVDEPPYEDPPA